MMRRRAGWRIGDAGRLLAGPARDGGSSEDDVRKDVCESDLRRLGWLRVGDGRTSGELRTASDSNGERTHSVPRVPAGTDSERRATTKAAGDPGALAACMLVSRKCWEL